MICVNCGSNNANKGSMKHPYCSSCFTKVWKDDYEKYFTWLNNEHDNEPNIISLIKQLWKRK